MGDFLVFNHGALSRTMLRPGPASKRIALGRTSTREDSIVGEMMLPSACTARTKIRKVMQWVIPWDNMRRKNSGKHLISLLYDFVYSY